MDELIKETYYETLEGVEKLYQRLKDKGITRKQIKEVLAKQEPQQIHKQIARPVYHSIVGKLEGTYQCDIMFYQQYKQQNGGYECALLFINVNTRKAYGYPMKSKSSTETANNLAQFVEDCKGRVVELTHDDGKEWQGLFKKMLDAGNITEYICQPGDHTRLSRVDSLTKTLRGRIEKYFTAHKTVNWVKAFPTILANYNSSFHRTIGMAPNNVTQEHEQAIIDAALKRGEDAMKRMHLFNVGDKVRLQVTKTTFAKGAEEKFSDAIYTISRIEGFHFYVKNHHGNELKTAYKYYNLQKVNEVEQAPGGPPIDEPPRKEILRNNKINRRVKKEKLQIFDEARSGPAEQIFNQPISTRLRPR